MVQGSMPCDNVGSFKALRAGWAHLPKGVSADTRVANASIISVLRALNANRHWTVSPTYVFEDISQSFRNPESLACIEAHILIQNGPFSTDCSKR